MNGLGWQDAIAAALAVAALGWLVWRRLRSRGGAGAACGACPGCDPASRAAGAERSGGASLIPVSELTRVYLGGTYFGVHLIVFGGILMGVMLFLPRGINDSVLNVYDLLMHKLEKKRPPLELQNGTARD